MAHHGGASSGFGRAIAEAALGAGDMVVAAARRPAKEVDRFGIRVLIVEPGAFRTSFNGAGALLVQADRGL